MRTRQPHQRLPLRRPVVRQPARRLLGRRQGQRCRRSGGSRGSRSPCAAPSELLTAKDDEEGVGTGKADFIFDGIISKEINQRVEVSGYGGMTFRGDPDNVSLSDGFRWGVGAGFPTRKSLRVTAELHGESQFDDVVYTPAGLVGEDGSLPPLVSTADSFANFTVGLTWIGGNGMFVGAGANWRFAYTGRSAFGSFEDESGDTFGFQFRLGYHPGVRIRAATAATTAATATDSEAGSRARREGVLQSLHGGSGPAVDGHGGCVEFHQLRGDAYAGRRPQALQRSDRAAERRGRLRTTKAIGHGDRHLPAGWQDRERHRHDQRRQTGRAAGGVRRRALRFRRYSLRPEATRALDEAIKAMQGNPALRIRSRDIRATSARLSNSRWATAARTPCAIT